MQRKKTKTDISSMTRMSLLTAVLCISSYLAIPLPFTPIVLSMQTVAVNLIGFLLKPKQAVGTIILYLIMGIVGLPVFSGGTSGAAKLFGPTGGFYFGFLFAVLAISLLCCRKNGMKRYLTAAIGVGLPIQHTLAILFMCMYNGVQISTAAAMVSLPFIPVDIVKCIIASFIACAMDRANKKKML